MDRRRIRREAKRSMRGSSDLGDQKLPVLMRAWATAGRVARCRRPPTSSSRRHGPPDPGLFRCSAAWRRGNTTRCGSATSSPSSRFMHVTTCREFQLRMGLTRLDVSPEGFAEGVQIMGSIRRGILVALALLIPALAFAQGEITGIVRDNSGAVLPGVTVEASSPALIEKVRVTVTDGVGRYRIVGLRPGTYAVTFGLTGFSSFRREGIELTGTFVATIDAQLQVGALEETLTVTGEAPVVDVQSTTRPAGAEQRAHRGDSGRPEPHKLRDAGSRALGQPGARPRPDMDVGGTNNLQNTLVSMHGGANVRHPADDRRRPDRQRSRARPVAPTTCPTRARRRKSPSTTRRCRPSISPAAFASTSCRAKAATRSTDPSSLPRSTSPGRATT